MSEVENPQQIPQEDLPAGRQENSPDATPPVSERDEAFSKIDSYSDRELQQKGFELGIEGPTSKIREALKAEWDTAYEEKAKAAREKIENQRPEVAGPVVSGESVKAYQESVEAARLRAERAEEIRLVEAAKPSLQERAAEAGRKKAGEITTAAREKAPVVRAEAEKAAENFSLLIDDVIVRTAPKVESLIERGKRVLGKIRETDPREALASLIDLPANFTEMVATYVESVALKREERAQRMKEAAEARDKERKEKEKEFNAESRALKKEAADRKADIKDQWISQVKELEGQVATRRQRIEDKYRSYRSFPRIAEKRQRELEQIKGWRDEKVLQLNATWEARLADGTERFQEASERLRRKYGRRIEAAIRRTEKAEERAVRTREEADVVRVFADTWRGRANRMRKTSDAAIVAFLGA